MTSPMDKPVDVVERVARSIAAGMGDDLDNAFVSKVGWTAARGEKGGRFRDINEPFRGDYLAAAMSAIAEVVRAMGEVSPGMARMGTAAISYDGPPPDDAPGDPDYADDVSRSYKAMLTAWARENGVA